MRGVAIFSLLENFAFSSNCTKRNILAKKLATIWLQTRGGGGLVFQDRYRLDRLAHKEKFRQWGK
jgi:hypothetical protein